jgi:Protein of unknown function (DUF3667)
LQRTFAAEPSEDGGALCQNCGAGLSGAFCSECGQSSDVEPEPLLRFLRTGAEETLSLDGRLLRGIRDLATRPGFLTEEYHRGRRAQHMHPFRLLLVVAAIAYGTALVVGSDRTGAVFGLTEVVVGGDSGWFAAVAVVVVTLLAAAAHRLVYWRPGWLYVEHLVLVVHALSFGLLLAPIETLLLLVLPSDPGGLNGTGMAVLPIMVVYWVLTLREVFKEPLPVTLLRALGVSVATVLLVIGALFPVFWFYEWLYV